MATTCFGGPGSEDSELATAVAPQADAPQPAAPPPDESIAAWHAPGGPEPQATGSAPSDDTGTSDAMAKDPVLPLEQMTLRIDDGLLMVFGPEGDPVPPAAFAEAAATRPDARLRLPDGSSAPAARIAAVLGAQSLGRLGAAEHSTDWILAMVHERQQPEPASEEALRAEEERDPVDLPAAISASDAGPASDEQRHGQPEIDPERIVLVVMRGVPEGARLSSGVRDDDGGWSISPLDLASVTISLPAGGGGARQEGTLSITGIALDEAGELVAVSENVPLADYLSVPDRVHAERTLDAAPKPVGAPAGPAEPRAVPLRIDSRAWADATFDALVIRDLPAGARLSAGAYDPAIDGWVLMPQDLGALAILPPPDLRANVTLTLMGIALSAGEAEAARVLARLPVELA